MPTLLFAPDSPLGLIGMSAHAAVASPSPSPTPSPTNGSRTGGGLVIVLVLIVAAVWLARRTLRARPPRGGGAPPDRLDSPEDAS